MIETSTLKKAEVEPLLDHCGIVAGFNPQKPVRFFDDGVKSAYELQNRGGDGSGFAFFDELGQASVFIQEGRVLDVYTKDVASVYQDIESKLWVFQNRWGTYGASDIDNLQPKVGVHTDSNTSFIFAHNGQIPVRQPVIHTGKSDSILFAEELMQENGESFPATLSAKLRQTNGAYSMAIGTPDTLYLARDKWGIRPLAYGKREDGTYVAASEVNALESLCLTEHEEVMPGELIAINKFGVVKTQLFPEHTVRAHCEFENVYTGNKQGAVLESRNTSLDIQSANTIDHFRRQCGVQLAKEAPVDSESVDLVIGVPSTAVPGAQAYAGECGVPYEQALWDREEDDVRTFQLPNLDGIYQEVIEHFDFDADTLRGARVVLVDDSVVRGNVTKGLTHLLKTIYNVKEVHVRVLSPKITDGCHLGVNTRSKDELIAVDQNGNVRSAEAIRKEIGADSLYYLSSEGLDVVHTINDARGMCRGCMEGHIHPEDKSGNTIWKLTA